MTLEIQKYKDKLVFELPSHSPMFPLLVPNWFLSVVFCNLIGKVCLHPEWRCSKKHARRWNHLWTETDQGATMNRFKSWGLRYVFCPVQGSARVFAKSWGAWIDLLHSAWTLNLHELNFYFTAIAWTQLLFRRAPVHKNYPWSDDRTTLVLIYVLYIDKGEKKRLMHNYSSRNIHMLWFLRWESASAIRSCANKHRRIHGSYWRSLQGHLGRQISRSVLLMIGVGPNPAPSVRQYCTGYHITLVKYFENHLGKYLRMICPGWLLQASIDQESQWNKQTWLS